MWTYCACGERHWGRWGAAGLLLTDPGRTGVVLACWLVYALGVWRPVGRKMAMIAACFFAVFEEHQEAVIWYSATMETLRNAIRAGSRVLIGCADPDGTASRHTLLPISMAAGFLRGHEDGTPGLRSFPLHRITAVRAKQRGFEVVGIERAAIDRHEPRVGGAGQTMDRVGGDATAAAFLTANQHAGAHRRSAAD